ncbi:MAG: hypothetical protein GXO26_03400 [Crenarchaeota archaeon]|nr:hypothetical protein [Thermoproteota archaeon]
MRFGKIELCIGLGSYIATALIFTISVLYSGAHAFILYLAYGIIFLILTLILVLWVPIDAYVEGDNIVVKYIARKQVIGKIQDIKEIRILDKVKFGLLMYGNKGFFGWDMIVDVKDIGTCHVKACRRHNVVYIEFRNGKKYIISPKDPEKFVEEIRKRIESQPAEVYPIPLIARK